MTATNRIVLIVSTFIALVLVLTLCHASQAQPLTNGSFETSEGGSASGWTFNPFGHLTNGPAEVDDAPAERYVLQQGMLAGNSTVPVASQSIVIGPADSFVVRGKVRVRDGARAALRVRMVGKDRKVAYFDGKGWTQTVQVVDATGYRQGDTYAMDKANSLSVEDTGGSFQPFELRVPTRPGVDSYVIDLAAVTQGKTPETQDVEWDEITVEQAKPINLDTTGYHLSRLPLLPSGVRTAQFASKRPNGFNGDMGHFLYEDDQGRAVIFDAVGPGCIKSWWSTEFRDDRMLLFFFDDEEKPRLRISESELFSGKHPLFPAPLSSITRAAPLYGDTKVAGNCFVPMPYAGRLKIAIEQKEGKLYPPGFYHIIYETFTPQSVRAIDFLDVEGKRNPAAAPPQELLAMFEQSPPAVVDPDDDSLQVLRAETEAVPPSLRYYFGRGYGQWRHRPEWQGIDHPGAGTIRRLSVTFPTDPQVRGNLYLEVFHGYLEKLNFNLA